MVAKGEAVVVEIDMVVEMVVVVAIIAQETEHLLCVTVGLVVGAFMTESIADPEKRAIK